MGPRRTFLVFKVNMTQAGSKSSRARKEQWEDWTEANGRWRPWRVGKVKAEPAATTKARMHAEMECLNPNYELDDEYSGSITETLGFKTYNPFIVPRKPL